MAVQPHGSGLALSGGGYRAGLFHLGSLWRLNELGWLRTLDDITSVSGGSITAAWLGLRWHALTFGSNNVATNFADEICQPLRRFFSDGIDTKAISLGILDPFGTAAEQLAKAYEKGLFAKHTLQDLPDPNAPNTPRFTLYATNLQTGVSVRLARDYLADYRLGRIDQPQISLATAVAASSGFPPFFCPVKIKTDLSSWIPLEGADLFNQTALRQHLLLGDGGIYDNMGLQRLINRRSTVLVSDAGAPLEVLASVPEDYLRSTLRVLDIITEQTRALRKRALIDDFQQDRRTGSYWGIATTIGDYASATVTPLVTDSPATAALAKIRTRLDSFSRQEQDALINWGYALTDAAMRRYVTPGVPAGHLPF